MPFRPLPFRSSQSRSAPPDETYREAEYLKSLGESRAQVTVKLESGEMVEGWIEYYDERMIRLTREGQPNLFIFKHDIAYISEGSPRKLSARAGRSGA